MLSCVADYFNEVSGQLGFSRNIFITLVIKEIEKWLVHA